MGRVSGLARNLVPERLFTPDDFMIRLPLRSTFRLLPALAGSVLLAQGAFAQSKAAKKPHIDGISDDASAQIATLLADKESRTPAQQKMDSQLIYAAKAKRGDALFSKVPDLKFKVTRDRTQSDISKKDRRVIVDVRTYDQKAASIKVEELGGAVLEAIPGAGGLLATMPVESLETLAAEASVRFIGQPPRMEIDTGSVTTEGDRALAADTARSAFALNAGAVKIGVLSDSATAAGIANSIANGNLGANQVTVVPGQNGTGADEGLAMLEIINDIIPGAQLFFATANSTPANFANNIRILRNTYSCDIIVDDIRYGNETPFQDGPIAQAVDDVMDSGALYFASAGNSGNKTDGTSGTWVGDFLDGGDSTLPAPGTKAYRVHNFGTAAAPQLFNTCTGGSSLSLSLFWADPNGASTNDYDVFRLNAAGTSVTTSSTTTQNGTQDAYENTTLTSGSRIVVVKAGVAAPRALYLTTGRGTLTPQYSTNGFARGHSAASRGVNTAYATAAVPAAGAFTTGAPNGPFPNSYTASQATETFSSDGPARKFFNSDGNPVTANNFLIATGGGATQLYPVITAPDGVTTSVPGFAPFYGTSAAAPHAAAVAALLKSFRPGLTQAQMFTALTSTALDIKGAGVENDTGYGILRPVNILSSQTSSIGLVYTSSTVSGGNGNGGVDFNETNNLAVAIQNVSGNNAPSVAARLSTTTPGVTVGTPNASYGSVAGGATASNLTPFVFTTSPNFQAGTPINFVLTVTAGRKSFTLPFKVATGSGVGTAQRFDYTGSPITIPATGTTNIVLPVPITVSGLTGVVGKVTVSFYITHTYDSDLTFALTAPDGTNVALFGGAGGSGANFGSAATPDSSRTTLDDAAATAITAASAPFVGTYKPSGALATFNGILPANANGTWTLTVTDTYPSLDGGAINAVSLFVSPVTSVNGGNP